MLHNHEKTTNISNQPTSKQAKQSIKSTTQELQWTTTDQSIMPTHVFNVAMACDGCSGAVQRVLKKLPEVEDISIDMAGQTVTVVTSLSSDAVLEQIKKTGKETSFKETK
ncbi:metal homeostasis factor ATX1 [Salpingoeca rosetta]|uniref:Metal homeostasis factor ATX1 n=1 Tax=Salpingoeca rosetta (strain ATCC 50818 / BSB-021) TaxID=946362 RepID=F2UEL2_SALR5|nr:metal homeostasis factor ATX1 [Salpingoeca rosetta]EGD75062.1 metal homeostasis factor ATX1 [Salpingoeca rosetta]|eukprot:XP_004992115.1 metal homeostasis factor ATX1 [Salpingoeca rosetta]